MAAESRRAENAVAETLEREPWRFEFFQAVRLLEARARRGHETRPMSIPEDLVHFRATLSRSFPAAEIKRIGRRGKADDAGRLEMEVAFFGLTGPLGVLPEHYSDLLYRRVRARDFALRDFFDLFNHRAISLFYRAWEKYRPVVAFERALREGVHDDSMTRLLTCLVGLGTSGQAERQAVADSVLLGYAGHFSHRPRSAWALKAVLTDHFRVPVEVEQFAGRWLKIDRDQRSRLPGGDARRGQFNQLGIDTVIGTFAWDEQSKFRLRLGPLNYATFERFLPRPDGASAFPVLAGMARAYAGTGLDFDVRLVLLGDELPALALGGSADGFRPHLGWNTWLGRDSELGNRDDTLFGGDIGA